MTTPLKNSEMNKKSLGRIAITLYAKQFCRIEPQPTSDEFYISLNDHQKYCINSLLIDLLEINEVN